MSKAKNNGQVADGQVADGQVADGQADNGQVAVAADAGTRPPGVVNNPAVMGPQEPLTAKRGSARLREVLQLSERCDIEQVCDDAAQIIEELRRGQARERPWRMPSVY